MQNIAHFRFYSELNDFLPPQKRATQFDYSFSGTPSVKDAVEAIGVPHTEIDLIIVNGKSIDFEYQLKNGDDVAVYPVFESFDITPVIRLRQAPLRDPKFICDVHLGALARLLRLTGFNTLYRNDYADEQIVDIAVAEKRCILTRDRGILKRKAVTHGYCLRSTHPEEQAREVLARFDLYSSMKPFTLCIECGEQCRVLKRRPWLPRCQKKRVNATMSFTNADCAGKYIGKAAIMPILRKSWKR